MKKLITLGVIAVIAFLLFSWGKGLYNGFVTSDEGVNTAWSQVETQYQRRYDLIPNLVETVKGFAEQEKEVLVQVTEARAKMGGMVNLSPDMLNDPAMLQKFQAAQSSLGSALQRLMVVVEKYPELKSDQNFRDLQRQLEGTENRIATEVRRFNETVQVYNTGVRLFPANIIAGFTGFEERPYFQSAEGAQEAPKVKF